MRRRTSATRRTSAGALSASLGTGACRAHCHGLPLLQAVAVPGGARTWARSGPAKQAQGVRPVHRSIEIRIGRPVTDEELRAAFRRVPRAALADASTLGIELSRAEVTALFDTDRTLWDRVATELDDRLQKASLPRPMGREERS